jgi:hypothetical protein
VAFIGLRASLVDVWMNIRERLYRPVAVPAAVPSVVDPVDPRLILDVGGDPDLTYQPAPGVRDGRMRQLSGKRGAP